jgi:tRNA-specific 2-thiouridylase
MIEKVIVGISGGVDSSVAALLLKQQGYDVEGLFMKNWDERSEDGSCMWEADVDDAMQVCKQLEIPLNTVDLSRNYWNGVFENFIKEYASGRTPNPDILCNQEVKFKAFLEHAVNMGASKIATGHYARIVNDNGTHQLAKAVDKNKDQSYFLCRVNQDALKKTLFPLGELTKPEIRKMAEEASLITHDKKDSTGICFIGERPFRDFLSQYLPVKHGPMLTLEGKQVGEHEGVHFYTLGQRQGLGIGGVKDAADEPWYVISKDVENNSLTVAQGHDHPELMSSSLKAVNLHWIGDPPSGIPYACYAKTRYRQADQACVIESMNEDSAVVRFAEPQRATTPGQYAVFYDQDRCLGGGVIDYTEK